MFYSILSFHRRYASYICLVIYNSLLNHIKNEYLHEVEMVVAECFENLLIHSAPEFLYIVPCLVLAVENVLETSWWN